MKPHITPMPQLAALMEPREVWRRQLPAIFFLADHPQQ